MKIGDTMEDDGYRGLIRNPETGQVMYASRSMAMNRNLERIDSIDQKPAVKTSKPVRLVEEIVNDGEREAQEQVVEATPEEEVSTGGDDAEFALVSIEAEVGASNNKDALKAIGGNIGVKLTKAMNVATMKERILAQVAEIRAASEGA
jgi:hypothetical protein